MRLPWLVLPCRQLFFEKALDLFLPELISRWTRKGTNHVVSVILFARVMYDRDEVKVVQRPMMRYDNQKREDGKWTDVYKVIVDLETGTKWKDALQRLRKDSAFARKTEKPEITTEAGLANGYQSRTSGRRSSSRLALVQTVCLLAGSPGRTKVASSKPSTWH